MLDIYRPRFVIGTNYGDVDIPPFSIVVLEDDYTNTTLNRGDTDFIQYTHRLNIRAASSDGERPIGVTGPLWIRVAGEGPLSIDGYCVVRVPYQLGSGLAPGTIVGAKNGEFVAYEGHQGLEIVERQLYDQYEQVADAYYCRFQGANLLTGANMTYDSGSYTSVASGSALSSLSAYSVTGRDTDELTYYTASGRIVANADGTYQFGFSLSVECDGNEMKFGLYNVTDTAYTGHYGRVTGATGDDMNICVTGLVNATASDQFEVRNASSGSVNVNSVSFWMTRTY